MARPPQIGPAGRVASQEGDDRQREQHASEVLAAACDELERGMDELRARYELYFLGIERVEPVRDRALLKQEVNRLLTTFTRNAGLRFRVQALHARFISYERLWLRNSRAREDGTYGRDLFKARRRGRGAARKPSPAAGPATSAGPPLADAPPPAESAPAQAAAPADAGGRAAAAGTASAAPQPSAPDRSPAPAGGATPGPVRPAPAAPPRAASPAPPRSEDPQLRALYDAYVSAKKRCNEDVSRLSYEAVARTVAQQTPQLRERLKAKEIDFKVVIQDGRAVLKAVPRG